MQVISAAYSSERLEMKKYIYTSIDVFIWVFIYLPASLIHVYRSLASRTVLFRPLRCTRVFRMRAGGCGAQGFHLNISKF